MLIEFSVGNYKSFKENQIFSMLAANITAKDKELDENNLFPIGNSQRLLKSTAIYGANASGKSNLIQAFFFMRRFVLESATKHPATEPIDVESFRLNTETEKEPSYFEIVFFTEGKRYRYGFEADAHKVYAEWLYHVPNVRESKLFEREENDFSLSTVFKEGKGLTDKTRDNALFLSVVAQFNGTISLTILRWFQKLQIISGLQDVPHLINTIWKIEEGALRDDILSFVKEMDVGISDLKIERIEAESNFPTGMLQPLRSFLNAKDQIKVTTLHKKYNNENIPVSLEAFDLNTHESEGTKKIFSLSGLLMDVLRSAKVLIVDELDARLHPLITIEIIKLFNSKKTNPHNAQLIFATHDTNLLSNELFRRDQIWFVDKDKYGATDLYSLAEYKVRNDASFEKNYLLGRYRAIPFIGGLDYLNDLIGEANGETKK
ncbi:MAG: AAA family ATPase [Ardenticatenaceae bacterium]